jgi:hypothetical protein
MRVLFIVAECLDECSGNLQHDRSPSPAMLNAVEAAKPARWDEASSRRLERCNASKKLFPFEQVEKTGMGDATMPDVPAGALDARHNFGNFRRRSALVASNAVSLHRRSAQTLPTLA